MRHFPLVTLLLIATNCAVYFLLEQGGAGTSVCYAYGLVPAAYTRTGALSPLVTSLFLHDPTTLVHLGGNMVFLAIFGAVVEGELGHLGLTGLYLAAGVAGGLLHVLVAPHAAEPLVGASGAIFGLVAVGSVLRPRLIGFAVALVAINIWHAFMGGAESVSFGCHLGGFCLGVLAAFILRAVGYEALETA